MQQGRVIGVYIAPDSGDPMEPKSEVEAVANRGLRGDRYFDNNGLWNLLDQDPDRDVKGASDVTFIETEAIAAAEDAINTTVEPGAHRRNITTQGVALNHLVGERFTVGDVVCEGIELCEPCGYMQSLIGESELSAALIHRGGLNATIVTSGTISADDEIRWDV